MASLKLSSRTPIKHDECMKRTVELELCHLAVPSEGSGGGGDAHTRQNFKKKESLILHAPHPLVNIFLDMYIISFDSLYASLSAAK